MRGLLVVSFFALGAQAVVAQTPPRGSDDSVAGTAAVTVAAQPAGVPAEIAAERPAEVVARMAREAMGLPTDPTRWTALAQALPDLALAGGADIEATFEAARIADSLSSSTQVTIGSTEGSGQSARVPTSAPVRWGEALLAAFGLGAVLAGGVLLRRNWRRDVAPRLGSDRLGTARTLATSGLAVPEIARRTGMAQDAVQVLLSIASPVPRPVAASTGPTATQPPVIQASELQREVRRAAHRLRDRRLTYGPGAHA